jgi:hypothetical protein
LGRNRGSLLRSGGSRRGCLICTVNALTYHIDTSGKLLKRRNEIETEITLTLTLTLTFSQSALARTISNCKLQIRPLIREGARYQQTRNCLTVILQWAPHGLLTPRQIGQLLTVGRNILTNYLKQRASKSLPVKDYTGFYGPVYILKVARKNSWYLILKNIY